MHWKFVYFIFLVFFFALFASFNLKHTCDISILFMKFEEIPVYITSLFSFLTGCAVTLPFLIRSGKKTKKAQQDLPISGIETINLKNEKHSFFRRKKKTANEKTESAEDKTSADSNA